MKMTVNPIYRKLEQLDTLSPEAARDLFLNSNPIHLEQALKALQVGNLNCIHKIHETVNAIFDPKKREDRAIFRMIRQIPDVLTVGPLLNSTDLKFLQNHLHKKSLSLKPDPSGRVALLFKKLPCRIEANRDPIIKSPNLRSHLSQIIKTLLLKALEGASKLDGERAFGNYQAEVIIERDYKTHTYALRSGLLMHHDYNYTRHLEPNALSSYTFLGVLSDKRGALGWKGGDLVVQNEATPTTENIPFNMERPYLIYEYPLNEAICLRNTQVVHQRTGIQAKSASGKMARDLLIVNLYQ